MKFDKLVSNLIQKHGLLPNTLRNLSDSGMGVFVFGNKSPASKAYAPPEGISSPFIVDEYKINKFIRELDASPKNLIFSGHSSASEFYVFNTKLRMFLGSDNIFYSISDFNERCVYASMKSANISISEYDEDVARTFKVYEKIYTAFLNEYNVEAQLNKTVIDSTEVIALGEETALYKILYTLESLIEEKFIPSYEIYRLHNEGIYSKIKGFDNRATLTLQDDEAKEYTEYLRQVFVQESPDQRPITLETYMKNSIW